ncbi:protein FAM177A1-like [Asterias amurensis]|uniref:protein FAM177A1-like n=1 Tax=Asterias amurensis TaxID=7602 RepID=UPI003AB81F34
MTMTSLSSESMANVLLQGEKMAQAPATDVDNISLGIKKPKRVIHFSDGIMEEYSSDEEDGPQNAKVVPAVDPKTLKWGPYLWYYTVAASTKTLGVCDFLGERLAYFLGITSPKYQYAINEYNRLEEDERRELDQEQAEQELHRERIAIKQADRVYAETTMPYTAANPGLGTDL